MFCFFAVEKVLVYGMNDSLETRAERNVIMPTTVWRWRENLSTFSTFRSFEQVRGEFYHRLSRRHSFYHAAILAVRDEFDALKLDLASVRTSASRPADAAVLPMLRLTLPRPCHRTPIVGRVSLRR